MAADTRDIILEEAEFLIRTRGYTAFSYADLAERAAITKASVHYHFPTKADLIVVLLEAYIIRFNGALAGILSEHSGMNARLNAYANLFLAGFEKGMLPLCGALSAERSALPEIMHPKVHAFFQIHIDWLTGLLAEAEDAGQLRPGLPIPQIALLLLSTLEGGSFVGWAMTDKAAVLAAFDAALLSISNP